MKKVLIRAFLLFWIFFPAWNSNGDCEEIILGMSADFSGPNRALGIEFYKGASCFFEIINAAGGIHGRSIIIKPYDDGYDPAPAVNNTIRLVEEDDVFALFNYVGTPTTTRIIPLLKYYQNKNIRMFTPLTGARPVSESEYIYSLRASYDDEIRYMVKKLTDVGITRIAVLHQLDAYGRGGWQSVKSALESRGLSIVAEATYERGASLSSSFYSQVNILKKHDPQAVICIAAYEPAAGFIRDSRNRGFNVPILNLSFVNAQKMFNILFLMEKGSNIDYTSGLINSQVVPFYGFRDLEPVQDYIECLSSDFYRDHSEQAGTAEDISLKPSSVGFEGYLNARFISMVLDKMEGDVQRDRISGIIKQLSPAESSPSYCDIFFQCDEMSGVYFISTENKTITSITDFSRLLH